jgi:hypothetical protein
LGRPPKRWNDSRLIMERSIMMMTMRRRRRRRNLCGSLLKI